MSGLARLYRGVDTPGRAGGPGAGSVHQRLWLDGNPIGGPVSTTRYTTFCQLLGSGR